MKQKHFFYNIDNLKFLINKLDNSASSLLKTESFALEHKKFNNYLDFLPKNVITPSLVSNKEYAPLTKQWSNGVYSFNKSFIKTLPSTDILVNKLLRSFFSINPIAYNPKGKKSRLVQRRFKRLSLNRILVSKPEVKHVSDKVYITVQVFNKKRRSLMYKLKHLYNNISFSKKGSMVKNPIARVNEKKLAGLNYKNLSKKAKKILNLKIRNTRYDNLRYKRIIRRQNLIFRHKFATLSNRQYAVKRNNLAFFSSIAGRRPLNFNRNTNKGVIFNNIKFIPSFKAMAKTSKGYSPKNLHFKRKVSNYKTINNLLRRKIQLFLSRIAQPSLNDNASGNNQDTLNSMLDIMPEINTILSNYYHALNKYKLYNNSTLTSHPSEVSSNFTDTLMIGDSPITKVNIVKSQENRGLGPKVKVSKGRLNLTMHKLNGIYKLFTYYNNIEQMSLKSNEVATSLHTSYDNNMDVQCLNKLSIFSNKILWNTYKLLNKNNIKSNTKVRFMASRQSVSIVNNKDTNFKAILPSTQELKSLSPVIKSNNKTNVNKKSKANYKKNAALYKQAAKLELTSNTLKKTYISKRIKKQVPAIHAQASKWEGSGDAIRQIKEKNIFIASRHETKNKKVSLLKLKKRNLKLLLRNTKNLSLIKNINKIDRFFKRYKKILLKKSRLVLLSSNNENSVLDLSEKNLSQVYKLNFIKEVLNKDLLYLYYIKMLNFNNTVFKSWFLDKLINLLSKIYNKKVILNIVNLKYIHLNSDIFLQAINIRLRNLKKNKLTKVLRKALKLVVVSKLNVYSYDINSPVHKYIENNFNLFKNLNQNIFSEGVVKSNNTLNNVNNSLQFLNNQESSSNLTPFNSYNHTPSKIRNLNHVQASTINFIKYKSVFGVRLEAGGRLTKRSTASRSVFKFRYKGSLKNNIILSRTDSSVILKNNRISNLQYSKISSKTRNGSFGLKGWINNN